MTVPEVAKILRCSPSTVLSMIHAGRLPAVIVGKNRYRVPQNALTAFLDPAPAEEDVPCDGI